MSKKTQPISNIKWVHRDSLSANNYNPNKVAPPELQLLKVSIKTDGWTQPIVVNPDMTIVDGYHRWLSSGDIEIYSITDGYVPIVIITPESHADQQMATIRHNRARGTHAVLNMSNIVAEMHESGVPAKEIMTKLQMEKEEVVRLAMRAGIPKSNIFDGSDFSEAWVPE